jgi:hypothetical protein
VRVPTTPPNTPVAPVASAAEARGEQSATDARTERVEGRNAEPVKTAFARLLQDKTRETDPKAAVKGADEERGSKAAAMLMPPVQELRPQARQKAAPALPRALVKAEVARAAAAPVLAHVVRQAKVDARSAIAPEPVAETPFGSRLEPAPAANTSEVRPGRPTVAEGEAEARTDAAAEPTSGAEKRPTRAARAPNARTGRIPVPTAAVVDAKEAVRPQVALKQAADAAIQAAARGASPKATASVGRMAEAANRVAAIADRKVRAPEERSSVEPGGSDSPLDSKLAATVATTQSAGPVGAPTRADAVTQVALPRDVAAAVDQLADQMDTAAVTRGRLQQHLRVQLGDQLGAVDVRLRMGHGAEAGRLHVTMSAAEAATASMLEGGLLGLSERLESRGYLDPVVEVQEMESAEAETGSRHGRGEEQMESARDDEAFVAAIGRRYRDRNGSTAGAEATAGSVVRGVA